MSNADGAKPNLENFCLALEALAAFEQYYAVCETGSKDTIASAKAHAIELFHKVNLDELGCTPKVDSATAERNRKALRKHINMR